MKIPNARLRQAAARREREEGGPSSRQEAPAPKRLTIRASPPERRVPPAVPEVDLTADTPPAGVGMEEAEGRAPEPAEPTLAEGEVEELPAVPSQPPEEAMVAASPRAEETRPRTEPESSAVGDKGKGKLKVPRASVMNDGRWAERLVSQVIAPEAQEELSHLGSGTFFREAYTACSRIINSLAATRSVIEEGKSVVREAQEEVAGTRARAEAAEKALEAARAEHAMEMAEALKRAEAEVDRARAALDQMARSEGLAEARRAQIAELEAATEQAREAKGRAASQAREQEARAVAAEAKIAEAEARVGAAVGEFRASEAFLEELTEATADSYLQGFRDAKEKVARVFNLPQARDIGMDDGPKEAPANEAET